MSVYGMWSPAPAGEENASAPPTFASVTSVKQEPDGLTCTVLVTHRFEDKQTLAKYNVLPLSLEKLPSVCDVGIKADSGLTTCPLHTFVTADHSALVVNVMQDEDNENLNKQGKPKKVTRLIEKPQMLANQCPITTSLFASSKASPPDVTGGPFFARMFNLRYVRRAKFPGRLFPTVDAIETSVYSELNALPKDFRLAFAFPSHKQLLPNVLALRPVYPQLQRAAQARKNKTWDYDFDVANRTIRITVNADYIHKGSTNDPASQPFVLPEIGTVARPTAGMRATVRQAPQSFHKVGMQNDPDELNGAFNIFVQQSSDFAAGASARRNYLLKDLHLYPEHFLSLGVIMPSYCNAMLRHNPIPFTVLGCVKLAETLGDVANSESNVRERRGYEDGILAFQVEQVNWHMRGYLVPLGVPISYDLLVNRFGEDYLDRTVSAEYTKVTAPRYNSITKKTRDKLVNPFSDRNNCEGVIALDDYTGKIPREGYIYRAIPCMALKEPLPMEPVDAKDPSSLAPQRVAARITTVEGDKIVLDNRGHVPDNAKPQQVRDSWLQPATVPTIPGCPKFLFFAIRNDVLAACDNATSLMPDETALVPTEADAALPATLEDYRVKVIVPAAAFERGEKRKADEIGTAEGDDEDKKRARVDDDGGDNEEKEEEEDNDGVDYDD